MFSLFPLVFSSFLFEDQFDTVWLLLSSRSSSCFPLLPILLFWLWVVRYFQHSPMPPAPQFLCRLQSFPPVLCQHSQCLMLSWRTDPISVPYGTWQSKFYNTSKLRWQPGRRPRFLRQIYSIRRCHVSTLDVDEWIYKVVDDFFLSYGHF